MKTDQRRVGDVIRLERRSVDVDPFGVYEEIGIRSFGNGIFHKEPVSGVDLGRKRVFYICPGDLVLSNVFAWEGAISLATEAERGCIGSHRFMTYVPVDGSIDCDYLRWFFLSEPGLALIRKASPGSAGRNRTLAVDRLEDLMIPLPRMEDQQRVSRHLDTVSEQLSRLEPLRTRAVGISTALSTSFMKSGAKLRSLGDLVKQVRREETVDASAEYRLLGVRWYGEGLFVRERKSGNEIAASKLYRIESGDFVYNRLFAWKGSFAVADDEFTGCHVSGEFPTFEIDRDVVDARYLLGLFSDPAVWETVEDHSVGGTPTSRNRLKEAAFLKLGVPVPSLAEQQRLADLVDRMRHVRQLRRRLQTFEDALRKAVLNQSFSTIMQ